MKTKKKNQKEDYLKANRKGSREAEIENHGHLVNYFRIQVSKKVYNRKRMKRMDQQRDSSSFDFIQSRRTTVLEILFLFYSLHIWRDLSDSFFFK